METQNTKELYQKAFKGVDSGETYERMSVVTGIPSQLLRLEHIRNTREEENYTEQLQKYTLNFIRKHGLTLESISKLEKTIPYKFRSAVKHLIYRIRKQISKRKLNALS